MKITKKPLNTLKTNYTGSKFGPYKVINYDHHRNTSPQWLAECEFCKKTTILGITELKKTKTCGCEELLKWRSKVFISNSILKEYHKKSVREQTSYSLTMIDLYKLYNRQSGKDKNGNDLVFEFGINYQPKLPVVSYVWPDLLRRNKSQGYNFTNCYFESNLSQRYPKRRSLGNRRMR